MKRYFCVFIFFICFQVFVGLFLTVTILAVVPPHTGTHPAKVNNGPGISSTYDSMVVHYERGILSFKYRSAQSKSGYAKKAFNLTSNPFENSRFAGLSILMVLLFLLLLFWAVLRMLVRLFRFAAATGAVAVKALHRLASFNEKMQLTLGLRHYRGKHARQSWAYFT